MKLLLLACLSLGCAAGARAQVPLTADAAYDYLQKQRARADATVGEGAHPPADSLQKGVRLLQAALGYYQRPEVVELAKTSKSLYARKGNILFDLAVLQSRLG